ncbi:membrane protein insertion efficiency factor YidD [Micromonospora mangrovi]|uniref:Putative membrane protein insertion efficiency factor n=2 Tax=Micromonospora TaxID=1873 RepID=A0AAU8H9D5_9ACTN
MPWYRYDPRPRRRYDPRYDPRYGGYGYGGYGPGYRSNSCLRDACLLETGCCLAESLDGNCLLATLVLLPRFSTAMLSAVRPTTTRRADRAPTGAPARALLAAIEVYQRRISATRPPCCRFSPSCSHYAGEAIRRHGAARGGVLAVRRLLRCRPGGARGSDPVPA